MRNGSKELDKRLKEILSPLGFMKTPNKRLFVRIVGEGVIQSANWFPERDRQKLLFCIDSIYSDNLLTVVIKNNVPFIPVSIDMCEYCRIKSALPLMSQLSTNSEDEDIDFFIREVIPLFKDCDTQLKTYNYRRSMCQSIYGNLYKSGAEINISLYLKDFDESIKYINESIDAISEYIETCKGYLVEFENKYLKRKTKNNKETFVLMSEKINMLERKKTHYEYLKTLIDCPQDLKAYLDKCKKKNLEDYNFLFNGKATGIISTYM